MKGICHAEDLVLQVAAAAVDPLARLRKLSAPIAARLQELGETD
ncbi:MAG TPA: hypothetical protein PJ982_06285 [Lacipirellulaceae bacterium]|nr:hypothetical protein [Lacipirellulaceae bacterium]